MLILSRMVDESIIINDNITIVVKEIVGNRVILGCKAPSDIPIWRGEVHDERSSELKGISVETQE